MALPLNATFFSCLLVGLGGALGSVLRFLVHRAVHSRQTTFFPWGTLTVNVTGAFVMALLMSVWLRSTDSEDARLFLAVGILGGYTTFSALIWDLWQLFQSGLWMKGIFYIGASVGGGLLAALLGVLIGRMIAA